MNSVVLLITFSLLPGCGARYKYRKSGWLAGGLTIETKVPKGWLPTRTAAHRSRPKNLVAHGRISLRALALFKVFRSTAMASSFRELTRSCLLTIRRSIVAHAFY